jgi:glycosyltransferase involved in cell wall biosynthesis
MKISVLIPTWRRPKSLARCLDALADQTRRPDELVLVVRGDDEESRALLSGRSLPFRIEVVEPSRTGVVAALNSGLDAVGGDVVAITDDDTAPLPDWLARIERHFITDAELGGLGGRDRIVGSPDGGAADAELVVGRIAWFGRVIGNHHLGRGATREVDILKGANMAVRRAALADRRLDTDLRGTGAEHHWEIDLSLALKRDGWRLAYDPSVAVDHYEAERHGGQREERMSERERFDAVHNQTLTLLRNLPARRRLVAVSYAFLAGTRADPGPLLALESILRGEPARQVAGRMRTATAGRRAALSEWRRARGPRRG